jgi:hypothetical protein
MLLGYFLLGATDFQKVFINFFFLYGGVGVSPWKYENVSGIITSQQCHLASHCKSQTLCDQRYANKYKYKKYVWPIAKVHLVTPIANIHLVTLIFKVHLVSPIAKLHLVTPIAKVHLVTPFAKAHPVVCIKDKFSIDFVKIWSKSVDWFKRYSINQYKGHVDLIFKNWSEVF